MGMCYLQSHANFLKKSAADEEFSKCSFAIWAEKMFGINSLAYEVSEVASNSNNRRHECFLFEGTVD